MTAEGEAAPLLIEEHGAVRVVRLNRPHALNAADGALHRRVAEVWAELESDPACRAVVVTGAGRAFCAGGDLGLLDEMHRDPARRKAVLDEGATIVRRMVGFPYPVVAAVNGPAVGLGCSLCALSDVVLVEESAYLADPHVSVGLVAGDGGAVAWPLLTSLLRAKEYLFTGDRIPAAIAVQLGLANRVVPDGRSLPEAMELANRLAAQPAAAMRETKRAINKHMERAVLEVLDLALAAEASTSASPEHGEIVGRLRARRGG